MKSIFIIGATGSLGSEALQVIKDNKDKFLLIGATGYNNYEKLAEICKNFKPPYIGVRSNFVEVLKNKCGSGVAVFDTDKRLPEILEESDPDLTLFLSSGISSIDAVKYLLDNKKKVGIANKETVIAAGELIFTNENLKNIIPVDSEPSAIFQCLLGEKKEFVNKLIITASGGPFWNVNKSEFSHITPERALRHPNWKMGKKITIDSATMANKAFEIIESHFLFDIPYEKIEAIIHRESIVHSLVEFTDGNIKAVMSNTRMYYPLQFAMSYPERTNTKIGYLDLTRVGKLTFYPMDMDKFPIFKMILDIAKEGGNRLPLLVASDEVAVNAFLNGDIKFTDIPIVVEKTVFAIPFSKQNSPKDIEETYKLGIMKAKSIIARRKK